MDDVAQAHEYLAVATRNGNPTPIQHQRQWNGQMITWGEPPIGWCSEPNAGMPLVPNSKWVQIFDGKGQRINCRVR